MGQRLWRFEYSSKDLKLTKMIVTIMKRQDGEQKKKRSKKDGKI